MIKPMHNLIPDVCVCCGARATMDDQVGMHWCPDCQHRGQLLNWGASQGYPALHGEVYAIDASAYDWVIAASLGEDDMIWMLLAVIEMIEQAA